MKKALIIFIFAFVANVIRAQTDKLEIGIEGGPSMTNYTMQPPQYISYDANLYQFSAGVTGQYNVTQHFAIKSGLVFEQKGYADVVTFTDNYGNFIKNVDNPNIFSYLILPAFAKISFGDKLKFYINGGPYFGYLLNATYKSYVSNSNTPEVYNNVVGYNQFDFGVSAGIGFERKIGDKLCISLETSYNYGLISMYPKSANSQYGRNGSADILLGLRYSMGK